MSILTPLLNKVADGTMLSREEAEQAFAYLMSGDAEEVEIAGFLMALRTRGESVDEITAATRVMREKSLKVQAPPGAIDTCGTGGSGRNTYNISTAVAFVVAACGVPVAKHGNKAASSKCGSADVLRALGVRTDISLEKIEKCMNKAGIGFLFAPNHHPAMKYVGPVRAKLATRSIFNLLGPLCNPASAKRQLLGVFSKAWLPHLAHVLSNLGSERAWIVHGADGLDELSTSGVNDVTELRDGKIRSFQLAPEEIGIARANIGDLTGGEPNENSAALRALFNGEKSTYRDVVLLNAAAALTVASEDDNLQSSLERAIDVLDNGKAMRHLDSLVNISNEAS